MPLRTRTSSSQDYRLREALKAGMKPVQGHMGSRVPRGKREGLILKKLHHPTFEKTIRGEQEAGYKFFRRKGKLYSFQKAPSAEFREVSTEKVRVKAQRARQRRRRSPR